MPRYTTVESSCARNTPRHIVMRMKVLLAARWRTAGAADVSIPVKIIFIRTTFLARTLIPGAIDPQRLVVIANVIRNVLFRRFGRDRTIRRPGHAVARMERIRGYAIRGTTCPGFRCAPSGLRFSLSKLHLMVRRRGTRRLE